MFDGKKFSLDSTQFPLDDFSEVVKPILQILAIFFGKEDTAVIDKAILGIFSVMMKPDVVLDIPSFGEGVINAQFMNLSLTVCFIFPSLITYIFLYIHDDIFIHYGSSQK